MISILSNLKLKYMKKILLSIVSALIAVVVNAQVPTTIDFETVGTDSAWYVFANVTDNPAYCAVADNPDNSGINTSTKVGMLEVQATANPWAGLYSTTAITPFKWSEDNAVITIQVYKDVVSDFDLKFEALNSGEYAKEVKVANTVTNEWEELIFDFTDLIGDTNTISRIIIIPDFPASRTTGSVNYFDNIKFGNGGATAVVSNKNSGFKIYPNPVQNVLYVSGVINTEIKIYDILGNEVLSQIIKSINDRIDVSNLKSGIYLIKAGDFTEKLVVK
jgi:hypothetical protein